MPDTICQNGRSVEGAPRAAPPPAAHPPADRSRHRHDRRAERHDRDERGHARRERGTSAGGRGPRAATPRTTWRARRQVGRDRRGDRRRSARDRRVRRPPAAGVADSMAKSMAKPTVNSQRGPRSRVELFVSPSVSETCSAAQAVLDARRSTKVNWKENEMDRREDYGGTSPVAWIIGAVLVAAAIYWLFGGFGG
jgi:hypothetical protein